MNTRKLIAIIVCMMTLQSVNAQTIHNIVFCATKDPFAGQGNVGIGPSVEIDNDRTIEEVTDIAAFIGYKNIDYVYNDVNCTKDKLMKVINSLHTNSGDIIFFYYSGHGTHAANHNNDPWPQMCLYSRTEADFVPLRMVIEQLKNKPHRLLFVLSDCCNNVVSGVSIKSTLDALTGSTIAKGSPVANYKRLFLESQGEFIATASRLGETSLGLPEVNGTPIGGLFSLSFWLSLYEECQDGNTPTWANIKGNTEKQTLELSTALHNKDNRAKPHHPYIVNNIRMGASSPTTPSPVPTPPSPATNLPATATNTPLSQSLTAMIAQQDVNVRLNMITPIINRHFAKGGHVITLGRNLTTVVDYEDAIVFLRRLATSDDIIRINVVKEETDSQGQPSITVTEVRKE